MKLRIKGNSIRMRLSQGEVDELASSGSVNDVINFGKTKMTYQLTLAKSGEILVVYAANLIIINIPQATGAKWATSDQVGIEEDIDLGGGEILSVLIEKDFKCLTVRPGENESDLYENPQDQHNA